MNLAFTVWNLGRHAAQAEQKYRQQPTAERFVEMQEYRFLYEEARSELDALERKRAEFAKASAEIFAKSVAEANGFTPYLTVLPREVQRSSYLTPESSSWEAEPEYAAPSDFWRLL